MTWEILWRILVGVGLGAAVGLEREVAGQPAGLRTHATVALGATLFGVVSTLGFDAYERVRELTNVQIDVTRVASQVVVGIGFLGAGLIFRQRGHVRNLTTAASLWAVAAVGLASGVGIPGAALIATVVLIGTLALLRPLRELVSHRLVRTKGSVRIRLVAGADADGLVALMGDRPELSVRSVKMAKEAGAPVLYVELTFAPGDDGSALYHWLAARPDVVDLSHEAEE